MCPRNWACHGRDGWRRHHEGRVLLEDPDLECLEVGARIDAQTLIECGPGRLIRGQSLCLASGPVEGEDALAVQSFSVRVLGDKRLQFARQRLVATGCEVCLDARLERTQP